MSEYVFPKVYSYTEGSGSGSGSGETFGPCDYCGFPPGTSIDTHFINITVEVSSLAVGEARCCPAVARETTKPCTNCGFPPGTNIDTHYINTAAVVDIDATGQAACCPVIKRTDIKPCSYCGFPEGTSIDTHYIDITSVVPIDADGIYACCPAVARDTETTFPCVSCGSEPGYIVDSTAVFTQPLQCCPTEPINNTECDPPCSGCSTCDSEGNCIELKKIPCEIDGLRWPSGTSIDTHYIDTTETVCPLDSDMHCPILPRDENDPEKQTTVINVPAKQIVSTIPLPNIYKTGEGTLVIKPPANPSAPDRPVCKSIIVEDGTVVLADKDASNSETTIALLKQSATISLMVGYETPIVRSIQFGSRELVRNPLPFSYTSNDTVYSGTVDIGFGGLIIENVPSINEIRSLIIAGRNDGSWNGSYGFVTTKEVNGIKNIGYNVTENGGVLIKWAAAGDTNLDGVVDILDVANILSSGKYDSGATDATWVDGDFNYDGILDILDASLFLAGGTYDTGNYLPEDTSFEVSWTPNNKYIPNSSPLTVTTNDATQKDPIRIYASSTEWNTLCSVMSKWKCSLIPNSIFNVGVFSCHDSACGNVISPYPNSGACCKPDNSCVVVKDTTLKSALQNCEDLQGSFQGYNTACADQTCSNSQKQISDS